MRSKVIAPREVKVWTLTFPRHDHQQYCASDGGEDPAGSNKVRIITKARVKDLIVTIAACTRCVYEQGGAEFKDFDPVSIESKRITSCIMSAQNDSAARKYRRR